VQRPGVSPDEQPAALDECPKLGEVELPEVDDAIGRPVQSLPGGSSNAYGRIAV